MRLTSEAVMAGVTLKRERWPEFHSAATTESARADAADASRARTTRETAKPVTSGCPDELGILNPEPSTRTLKYGMQPNA